MFHVCVRARVLMAATKKPTCFSTNLFSKQNFSVHLLLFLIGCQHLELFLCASEHAMPPTLMWLCYVACFSHTGQRRVCTGHLSSTCSGSDRFCKRSLNAHRNPPQHPYLDHGAAPWWLQLHLWSTHIKHR